MWHSWLLFFLLGLVSLALGDDTFCFPTGNCYIISTTPLTFDNATMTCGFKGFLASMKNQQENHEIFSIVSNFQDQRNLGTFWLGLYLEANCTVIGKELHGFSWVSGGDTAEVSYWNNTIKQSCKSKRKCVILESRKNTSNIKSSAISLVWKDVRCNRKFPFICRIRESRHILATKDLEDVTHSSTDQYRTYTSVTDTTDTTMTSQPTEMSVSTSQVNVFCRTSWRNVTSSCTVTVSYLCNGTHCSCGNINDSRVLKKHRICKGLVNSDCLQQCVGSINISCSCSDHHTPCEEQECTTRLASSPENPVSPSTAQHSASSTSAPPGEDDNLLDRLIIPLILGLVAFGILVMLVWGGVQMCIRKRKPKRRKSIAPAPPEGSDTDSTDHSSSEDEDDEEEEEGESQDRTEDP